MTDAVLKVDLFPIKDRNSKRAILRLVVQNHFLTSNGYHSFNEDAALVLTVCCTLKYMGYLTNAMDE